MSADKYEWNEVVASITVTGQSPLGEALERKMQEGFGRALYGDVGVDRRTEAQKARTPGYYWVKFDGEWSIEEWTGQEWLFHGTEEWMSEDVGEIGPRIEPPEGE